MPPFFALPRLKRLATRYCAGLGLTLGLGACVAPGRVLQHLPSAMNAHMLPPLEPAVELGALQNTAATTPEDLLRLFQNEVYRNVAEPTGMATFGTAHLLVTEAQSRRTGRALQLLQFCTMLTPSLLGVPLETYQTTLTARVQICDAGGQLVAEYEGQGTARVRVALYYGFSQHQAPGLADALALRLALAEIRPQLDAAAGRLRPLLLASGPQAAGPAATH
jgi:hypothetical protein